MFYVACCKQMEPRNLKTSSAKTAVLKCGENKLSNIVLLHHFWGIDLFCSEMTGHKNVVPGGNGTLHVHHIKKRTSSKKKKATQ